MWRRDTCMDKFLSNGRRKENVKCVSSSKKIKKILESAYEELFKLFKLNSSRSFKRFPFGEQTSSSEPRPRRPPAPRPQA
jgi:hypothetical protein